MRLMTQAGLQLSNLKNQSFKKRKMRHKLFFQYIFKIVFNCRINWVAKTMHARKFSKSVLLKTNFKNYCIVNSTFFFTFITSTVDVTLDCFCLHLYKLILNHKYQWIVLEGIENWNKKLKKAVIMKLPICLVVLLRRLDGQQSTHQMYLKL